MKQLRFDPSSESKLFDVSWESDRGFRMNPATVSALLREQVPVLEFVNWRVTSIEFGTTESLLPLNPQSTNQHFTHQAALFLLAADYTGGTALASLLSGWPIVGVHPVTSAMSASLWLLKGEIRYLRPSVADLTVSARIDDHRCERIRGRFASGKPVIETINIKFFNGDVSVAEATATYFVRQSAKLRSEGVGEKQVNTLYELKLTSSAELIAGVRARQNGRLFQDPYAADMAGQHGMALATRFCERSPQLGGMVAARTWHLDAQLANFLAAGGRDVVIVGVGWDMRPFRLEFPPGTRIYELDYPTTLAERRRRLEQLGIQDPPGVTRVEIPIDLRTMSVASVVQGHLPSGAKVFLAWEGMTMYFQQDEVCSILAGMLPVLAQADSLLWCDVVDYKAVHNPHAFGKSVYEFMRGMQILGEPFTFGVISVEEFLRDNGLRCHEVVTSDVCLGGNDDPVYSVYRFCVASAQTSSSTAAPATFQATRIDADSGAPRSKPSKLAQQGRPRQQGVQNPNGLKPRPHRPR